MKNKFNVYGVYCNCCGKHTNCIEYIYNYPNGRQQVIHYCKDCFEKIIQDDKFQTVNIILDRFQINMIRIAAKVNNMSFREFINNSISKFFKELKEKSNTNDIIKFRGWLNVIKKDDEFSPITILMSKGAYENIYKIIKNNFFITDISFLLKLIVLDYLDDCERKTLI